MRVAPEDRGMLWANVLSLSRVPLAALLWIAPGSFVWVFGVMFVAGATDVADGWVARRWRAARWKDGDMGALRATSGRGAAIDGFADKVFVASCVTALYTTVHPPLWALAALLSRELLLLPGFLLTRVVPSLRRRVDYTAGVAGKAATVLQFTALVAGFLRHPAFTFLAIAAGALGVVASAHYGLRVFRARNDPDAATTSA